MSNNNNMHQNADINISLNDNDHHYYSSSKFNSYTYLNRGDYDLNQLEDPVVVNDDDPDDRESNIGLIFKQPSYLSLSDMIIMKGGSVIHDSNSLLNVPNDDLDDKELLDDNIPLTIENNNRVNSNPVIVFDSSKCLENPNEELSDSPIQLSVRQPSYVSLGPLEIIPKGSSSLADFRPKIKESIPNKDESNEIDEDQNPEIQFIQRLKQKNSKRWHQMGYKPPENLNLLNRSASLQHIEINNESGTFDLGKISTNYSHDDLFSSNQLNDEKENSPLCEDQKKMRRSSSFGMNLGEAENKSIEMMNEILGSSSQHL